MYEVRRRKPSIHRRHFVLDQIVSRWTFTIGSGLATLPEGSSDMVVTEFYGGLTSHVIKSIDAVFAHFCLASW
jgi:hypothetical protein